MIKNIITNIKELRIPCKEVDINENITQQIADLKDTLGNNKRGWGISANQIGYNQKISYINIPKKIDPQTKKLELFELILINPKIVEKNKQIIVRQEGCLSFPGLKIDTDRYVFIVVQFENEKREKQTALFQDLEALCIQHEIDHLEGRTIIDRKHRRKR